MNYIHIHYKISTGEIISWLSGSIYHDYSEHDDSHLPGCKVVSIEILEGHTINIDPKIHRIDLDTLELEDRSHEEIAKGLEPDEFEVGANILRELEATDQYVMLPPDRPKKGDFLLDWEPYREILRKLSELRTPREMIESWPKRPNGKDAIEALRQKLKTADTWRAENV